MSDDEDEATSIHSTSTSSSSSDDEFLTSTSGTATADREALVRKKLLESFYGASAVREEQEERERTASSGAVSTDNVDDEESDDDDPIIQPSREEVSSIKLPTSIPLPIQTTKTTLDSPTFHPPTHTTSHIAHSSISTLLQTNESLSLDIRHLDSTMQTLVYENYSKFISATDAIKSIGTNVTTAGVVSLDRLQLAMDRIQDASLRSENILRQSRENVAEKLRIQRLLVRLDALLCLPATLRNYISKSQWRSAVRAHKNATEILGRHSAGFTSLRCIEEECCGILKELVGDLKEKLLRWSGRDGLRNSSFREDRGEEEEKSIGEIFECAGTLLMLYGTEFCPGLDGGECRRLALDACGILLKERLVAVSVNDGVVGGDRLGSFQKADAQGNDENTGFHAVELPLSFLDGLLEATTLYGVSFKSALDDKEMGRELLGKFVTSNFDKFIGRVRVILFQQSASSSEHDINTPEEEESKEDANFHQVSLALSHLIRSVRELASGLALPEVGLDVSIASTLVDQAVELTEMLVRRRVAIKFYGLREVVVKESLAPLVNEIISSQDAQNNEEGEAKSPLSLVEMIQLANVALSDGLQMADDLIRATLNRSESTAEGSRGMVAPVDTAVVKVAVQKNARLFGVWLASSLEMLVGCETSDREALLVVFDDDNEDDNNESRKIDVPDIENDEENNETFSSAYSLTRNLSAEEPEKDYCSLALADILIRIDDETTEQTYSNFILAICEMCRLAERTIANTLNQSIQSAMKEESRIAESADTLFAAALNPYRKGKDLLDAEMVLAQRFKLAASRALAMYIMNRGALAASELCKEMDILSDTRDPYAIPSCPREECLKVLEVVKAACEDCISIIGGDLFSTPVAPFPEDQDFTDVFGSRMTQHSDKAGSASRGLQLDVERMFIEKTQVYPHALDEVQFTRNNVVSGILRVALSAFLECVRSSVFSSLGYRQMKVDAILIRYLLPHFVKDEFGTPEANACTGLFNILDDIMLKAGQRCVDPEVVGDDDYYDAEKDEIVTPYFLVRQFLTDDSEGNNNVMKRIAFV